ncbi:cytochrome aa3 quinol oxidase subunit II [Bacillus sp. USDA818B3_A]|uniref:cytochrome aa3 quinol oxidase subunit II n=1 Tax=Bacillus sp. USDA818B3_A TaxID=2698834 RepID=UPI0013715B39|nr:cytochrome aa3 quinol oxidase subunit II [Bacillus sp. USDA818B3_A]
MFRKNLIVPLLALLPVLLLSGCDSKMAVFDPKGPAAREILGLINWSLVLMALVVVVVFGLFGYIVWKYRATPENKDYEPPEEHGSTKLELIWTFIPILIVIALTIPTVKSIYKLEKVPAGYENKEPITINVTSADWKWIFSYPEEGIETVNYVNIPVDRPVKFKLTSAGTMQSFWVPQLGGQKYTMNKMETELILTADEVGEYLGKNTNFNGQGYAGMEFTVEAKSAQDFEKWVGEVKDTAPKLTEKKYIELLKPTHLGRETYVGTHLEWVDHGSMNSKTYTNPELYEVHGVKGKIFKDEQSSEETSDTSNNEKSNGGEQ